MFEPSEYLRNSLRNIGFFDAYRDYLTIYRSRFHYKFIKHYSAISNHHKSIEINYESLLLFKIIETFV